MARAFKPSYPYTAACAILTPTYQTQKGVKIKIFDGDGIRFNASFKTFGGTEKIINDVYAVEDTAVIETWYRNDITADCRIKLLANNAEYEIINTPENIDMRNQFMRFKVRRVGGGA